MVILSNAFSISMLPEFPVNLEIRKISVEDVKTLLLQDGYLSAVGHEDLVKRIRELLGIPIQVNRVSVKLDRADTLVVAQYIGPRLPEGATTLPEGARIEFFEIAIS